MAPPMNSSSFLAQGGPLFDMDNLLQLLVLFVFIGLPIIRAIFRNLGGGAQRRQPPAQGEAGGKKAKGLREFLEEIRQETHRQARGEGQPVPPQLEDDRELQWEDVEAKEPQQQPARADVAAQDRQLAAERRAKLQRRAQQQQQPEPEREIEHEREAGSVLTDRQLGSALTNRHVESKFAQRQLRSSLAERHLQSQFVTNRKTRNPHKELDKLPGFLGAMTVKDMLLAQVILGPPRSQQRSIRGNGV